MAGSPGRNDPCTCGSGKKYKKCCLDKDLKKRIEEADREFRKNLTETPFDEYFELMRLIQVYSHVLRFEPDGKEFFRADEEFVREFKPGKKGWIPDSYHMNWLLLDFRFGAGGKTVCERMIEKEGKKLVHPGPENLRIISGSYFAFYAVDRIGPDGIVLEDLYTLKKWNMQKFGADYFELEAEPGQVWYTRMIGVRERCYNASTPYVFDPEHRTAISDVLKLQVEEYVKSRGMIGPADDRTYAESCKDALRTWVRYMLNSLGKIRQDEEGIKPVIDDIEEFCDVRISYDIIKSEGFHEKMAATDFFHHDERNGRWIWMGPEKSGGLGLFGLIEEKNGKLTVEVNSQSMAAFIKEFITDNLAEHLRYVSADVRTLDEMPEMKNSILRETEDFYMKDWMYHPIPALEGKKPVDAVKTAGGKRETADLIDYMERMEKDAKNDDFDFNKLREALGIRKGEKPAKKIRKKTAQAEQGICYSFDIELADIEPRIWRRVRMPADATLEEFAYVIIGMFGWHGGHLHGFNIAGQEYGMMDMDDTGEMEEDGMLDERKITLSELGIRALSEFLFVYDFGDNWEHLIRLKEAGAADSGCMHPMCYDGARAAPPEDCGSVPGYYDIIEALKNKQNPTEEQKDKLEWLGEYYDPEYFNAGEINKDIKNLKKLVKSYRRGFER